VLVYGTDGTLYPEVAVAAAEGDVEAPDEAQSA
jgi:hypothetical protein